MTVFLQLPSIVQPVEMSIFMEAETAYKAKEADLNILDLSESLKKSGIKTEFLSDYIFKNNDNSIPINNLKYLAKKSLRFSEKINKKRINMAYDQLNYLDRNSLGRIIINNPKLNIDEDCKLKSISPDSGYEKYELWPLFGLIFPRDHFISLGETIVFGNLSRSDRRRETTIVKEIITRAKQKIIEIDLNLEGGDYLENEEISILNVGFRTDKKIAYELMEKNLINKEKFIVINDNQKNTKQFHLDHYLCLLKKSILIDEKRENSEKSTVSIYEKTNKKWKETKREITVKKAAEYLDYETISLDKEMMKSNCANSLVIGEKIWIGSEAPKKLISTLEKKGYEIKKNKIGEHEKQFGSIHCVTQHVKKDEI